MHFAGQAWDSGCAVALRGVLGSDPCGRRGEVCRERTFRVAGIGNGVTRHVAGHGFAWQAQ